jgi:hypothetical protein
MCVFLWVASCRVSNREKTLLLIGLRVLFRTIHGMHCAMNRPQPQGPHLALSAEGIRQQHGYFEVTHRIWASSDSLSSYASLPSSLVNQQDIRTYPL